MRNDLITLIMIATAIGLFAVRHFERSGLRFENTDLVIESAFKSLRIPYDSIKQVDRVKRTSWQHAERIKITFQKEGLDRVVNLKPANTVLAVSDILSRCPRLSSSRSHKLKRDRSFRSAKAARPSLANRRHDQEDPW